MSWSSAGRRSFAPLTPRVHVFRRVPSARGAVAAKVDQLVLAGLVGRAHARVDRRPHDRFPLILVARLAFGAAPFCSSHSRMPRRICSDTGMPSSSRMVSSASTRSASMRMFIACLLSSATWMSVSTRRHAMQAESATIRVLFRARRFWPAFPFRGREERRPLDCRRVRHYATHCERPIVLPFTVRSFVIRECRVDVDLGRGTDNL